MVLAHVGMARQTRSRHGPRLGSVRRLPRRPATQVHHKCYPKGAEPGSDGWIAREKLFDLVAACDECHTDIPFAEMRAMLGTAR